MRLYFIAACAFLGFLSSYLAQPYVHDNDLAVTIIVTVFAVFAGFLVAIVAVMGDPSLIPEGSWRVAENRREIIERRLIWHGYLFLAYIITIGLVFLAVVLKEVPEVDVPPSLLTWVERVYLFIGVSAFLMSLALPWALMNLQRTRIESEIQRRREQSGIRGDT